MSKNYYDILGVKKDADKKEIQKKYRKLSLKYHPDRQQGKTDEEKKEAEEKFKEASEAYSVLSDDKKRQEYDMFGRVSNRSHGMDMDDWMNAASHFGFNEQDNIHIQKGQTIKVNVNVTLEEIYSHSEIEVKYNRYIPCSECKGTGSKDGIIEVCNHCNGSGRLRQQYSSGYRIMISESTCPYCNGTGKTFKEPCHKCGGNGLELSQATLKVRIPDGCSDNIGMIVEGKGNAVPNNGGINGDLIIIFHVVENSIYSIDPNNPYNVIRKLELPVLDCITGCTCEIVSIDGKKYKITIKPNTLHNHKLRLKGSGLIDSKGNKGDMYINVVMKMPNLPLTDKEKELITELKQNKNFQ